MSVFLLFWTDYIGELLGDKKTAKSVLRHFDGIVQYAVSMLTNGLPEGINSKIQVIKRTARGFRYKKNFIRRILFVFGALQLKSY